jgi:hypothetical protein
MVFKKVSMKLHYVPVHIKSEKKLRLEEKSFCFLADLLQALISAAIHGDRCKTH